MPLHSEKHLFSQCAKQFSLSALTTPETNRATRFGTTEKPETSILLYMPEALMTSPAWSAGTSLNYFVIETVEGKV